MIDRKQRYRALCRSEDALPLFSQDWWLDAVAGEDWDVALCLKDDQVVASMPFVVKKRAGLKLLTMPVLTQHLGPWFKPTSAKYSKRLAHEKDLLTELVGQLSAYNFDHFAAGWPSSKTNWLPFYWAGFAQTTRYTYILDNLNDHTALWDQFQQNIRGDVRKAEGRFSLKIRTDLDVDEFLKLNNLVFQRQGMKVPYSRDLVKRIDDACAERKRRAILIAEDPEGRRHAGVYIVWDQNSAYYIMGGGDPELRNSGATSLCMWEAIKLASTVTKAFDFEGSMLEPVERFFRGFGASQVPYFSITKTPSKLLKTYFFLQDLRRKG
ncbi:GNAT family N-acetyltransferase [Pseudomonas wadenswilerensis]|uniref:GNAT family N-acetyltransferase n=1 Tax=Pseudomonas wadenswilerensis TaxID=1785161 RepID=UPI000F9C330A|nr:GNAT family N-acetyltransferase [Pseudomonas wadenswilerensis]UVM20604.1 GNAT family N-acetyltransferase [Pseudomonas wadenswilerensis]